MIAPVSGERLQRVRSSLSPAVPPTLGLIGGVGPLGGVDLAWKVCAESAARRDQDHPGMILLSLPGSVPDRTDYLLGRTQTNPGEAIGLQAVCLADLGCRVIAVACNTAHASPIWETIVQTLSRHPDPPRLLHIIEEVGRHLKSSRPELRCVGVLSTTGTWQARCYPEILSRCGISVVAPDAESQARLVHRAIYDEDFGLKGWKKNSPRALRLLRQAIQKLAEQGAEAIVLACTELPAALPQSEIGGLPLIDPNRVLARALLRAGQEAIQARP